MSTIPTPRVTDNGYPTSARFPMPETDWHRTLMCNLIDTLIRFFTGRRVYTSGNLLIFYEEGNRRRHISPDVFVARGVEQFPRPNYLIWEEGKAPEFVIELTSSTTRVNDLTSKMELYRDVLRVKEYFLFDPFGDFLEPRLQGYRLRGGQYAPIRPVEGRFPSRVIGLHLEQDGNDLRLWNPDTGEWEQPPAVYERERADAAQAQADAAQAQADAAQAQLQQTLNENQGLLQQLANVQAQLAAVLQAQHGNPHHPNGDAPHAP
ncbi:MAG: Uma2 family endonuclease [Gemmataceae bacterium]